MATEQSDHPVEALADELEPAACRTFAARLTAEGWSDCPLGDVDDEALEAGTPAALLPLATENARLTDENARLTERVAALEGALDAILAVQDADPDECGLMDAIDNDGTAYQSAHLDGLLKIARNTLKDTSNG